MHQDGTIRSLFRRGYAGQSEVEDTSLQNLQQYKGTGKGTFFILIYIAYYSLYWRGLTSLFVPLSGDKPKETGQKGTLKKNHGKILIIAGIISL